MNKHFYTLVSSILLTAAATYGQEPTPTDIMRYNQSDLNGTARFRGMSGAFGAVGGDLSSLSINPAGGAIFNHNTAAFSLSYLDRSNKSTYYGNKEKENYNGLDLGQMGAAFVFNNYNENATMKKFTIGLNYESTKNMRNDVFFRGMSNGNSLGDYFLNMANNAKVDHNISNPQGIREDLNNNFNYDQGYSDAAYYGGYVGQQSFLAYQSYILNQGQGNGSYTANYNQNSRYDQARRLSTSGFSSKFSGNFAAQLGKKFYVGANLNLHVIDHTQSSMASEVIENPGSKGSIHTMNYFNEMYTYGTGFSFNIGAIGQLTESLRAGLSYQSPTWYSLKDELIQGMSNSIVGESPVNFYPRVVNLSGSYRVKTPSHFTGSLAYVINKKGLISVDYTYKDYSNNKFKPTSDDTYYGLNEGINAMMTGTSEVRIGGEYLINQVSLRAGYRFEQSPYKDEFKMYGDLNSFSAGVGYTFGSSRLDLSYSRSHQTYKTHLVDTVGPSAYAAADIKNTNNFVSLTYNISF
ncbi:outer membrane protein transport protein [Myroides marinus]|uniref:Outer membrane insertion C-terminal signal n=1 Tax=Myroides marinus TaxID=703342 RepID=A0A1H6X7R9_9FLAO|nr:outer membrane protein transport protein [Myroides marinus]MDM1348546.1 outer membrane protein transport protein [Myroides marinus]MDM1352037.1 outer membrane protein transport protein [Myroides marinus]MDM1355645.1 outer membrane protein transport protein [Myroides marinus]MDM1359275.1 outer membrane protein transport protein [Myroides marinus]MDM1360486.1 outer membrane protein transport protein [Myroides marinus]